MEQVVCIILGIDALKPQLRTGALCCDAAPPVVACRLFLTVEESRRDHGQTTS